MNPKPQEIWQHYKTKGEYEVVALGRLQVKTNDLDMQECVIYKAISDEAVWVRPLIDFTEEVIDEKGNAVQRFEKQTSR